MPQAVDSIASVLEQISQQLENLERRVSALEARPDARPRTEPHSAVEPSNRPTAAWLGLPAIEGSTGAVAILGRAVLGMAGAYLLRALAETITIPKLPVLLVAILYAYFWMAWAGRIQRTNRFASATYALTSALILSPLLWESTVRFQVLSAPFASFWLVGFSFLGVVVSRRGSLQFIPWIATLSSLGIAFALIVETRELLPITAGLLAIALVFEAAACFGQRLTMRILPSLGADFAVWLLAYVLTSAEGVPEAYHAVDPRMITATSVLLLLVYGVSIGIRGFLLCERIAVLDIVQGALAVAVGSFGILRSTPVHGAWSLGSLFLLLAAGCYWGALSRFVQNLHTRNRRVAATWAAGLLVAATFLLVPERWREIFLCAAAILAAILYRRTGKISLGIHVSLYLAVAVAISPAAKYIAGALAGTIPASPDWWFWPVGLAAALCYAIAGPHQEKNPRRRLLWLVPVLLAGFSIAAVGVSVVVRLGASRMELGASELSVIRTIALSALALALGIAGSTRKRIELNWAAYAALGFGTIKLVLEDLRFGNAASLVLSLLFYGSILVLLPRLAGPETKSIE
ncbi:MAG TPA: hypothetical protein VGS27_14425 [Candidatus Sulfotelmatobacter sp.]|nr:hypothetical protein [Candidatus Sulfotelmatobacter sp.]